MLFQYPHASTHPTLHATLHSTFLSQAGVGSQIPRPDPASNHIQPPPAKRQHVSSSSLGAATAGKKTASGGIAIETSSAPPAYRGTPQYLPPPSRQVPNVSNAVHQSQLQQQRPSMASSAAAGVVAGGGGGLQPKPSTEQKRSLVEAAQSTYAEWQKQQLSKHRNQLSVSLPQQQRQ